MSKTRITKTKQRDLLKYLKKYIPKIDESLNITTFLTEIKKNMSNYIDNCIVLYYGDDIFTRNNWLKEELGIQRQAYLHYYTKFNEIQDSLHIIPELTAYSNLVIPDGWYQRVSACEKDSGHCEQTSLQTFITRNNGYEPFESAQDSVINSFVDKFYKVATPFMKLINESKYCEDIYKVWDDPEVYKILFPQKTYALSTISENDINNIKMFVRMAKQNENSETNKESEASES